MTTTGHFRVPFQGRPVAPAPLRWGDHAIRLWCALLRRTPAGLWRLLGPFQLWCLDRKGHPERFIGEQTKHADYDTGSEGHRKRLLRRLPAVATALTLLAVAGLLVFLILP
ncbi:MAG: hypothetical protein JWR88_1052, partial [Pseudonocardia sp.]|nr:hypothetical protein [Pseudonocardia sp.]